MRAVELIEKKKRGQELAAREIAWFIDEYVSGRVPDYQASAWLMAVWFAGMTPQETAALTEAMAASGDRMDLSSIPGRKVDKHSTGGVGDTTTLVAAPLAAACGVPVAKMSGRGLGHTGGTLDKLESIPGLSVTQSGERFLEIVRRVGLAVVGQSGNLTPADKMLYALRDVTATVDSLPLIAASIMSKKLAAGADAIVLDCKVGSGAFMGDLEDARALARTMVELGAAAGREVVACLTDMNQPLGRAVGNALEVAEAVEILSGQHGGGRLCTLSVELAAEMVRLGQKAPTIEEAREQVRAALHSGAGFMRFKAMVAEQGGDVSYLDAPARLYGNARVAELRSESAGFLSSMDVRELGRAAQILGAGRTKKDEVLDPTVGYVLHCELGDRVEAGDLLATIYYNGDSHKESQRLEAAGILRASLILSENSAPIPPMLYEILRT